MKKIFLSKNYSDRFTASSKAKIDCEIIAEKNRYKNPGPGRRSISNLFWGRIYTVFSIVTGLIRLPRKSVILLQYPTNLYQLALMIAKFKKARTITLIHDLNSLRGTIKGEELKTIGQSDVLIAHNNKMVSFLKTNHIRSELISLQIFDYLYEKPIAKNGSIFKNELKITFAGNLAKSTFLNHIADLNLKNTKFHLYGIGFDKMKNVDPKKITYEGFYSPDKLVEHLSGTFGLVWDGDSITFCSGTAGNYLKYNNPHKMSLYLLCGLPLLVWSQSAQAEFVTSNGLGFAVDSLENISEIEKTLTPESYASMVQNVQLISEKISTGYFLSQALAKAEVHLST